MSKSVKPTHTAYTTRSIGEGDGAKSIWTKLGSVWEHEDGEGFTIRLDALPVNGEIVVRKPKAKDEEAE